MEKQRIPNQLASRRGRAQQETRRILLRIDFEHIPVVVGRTKHNRTRINPKDISIDVGAHTGVCTRPMSRGMCVSPHHHPATLFLAHFDYQFPFLPLHPGPSCLRRKVTCRRHSVVYGRHWHPRNVKSIASVRYTQIAACVRMTGIPGRLSM